MSTELPTRPWQIVGIDLFANNGKDYIIISDYFSNFFELDRISSTSSKAVINVCKCHFARHGIPERVISDCGPQFRGEEFKQFAKNWEFEHRTSSPYHHQSNGKAENAAKKAK